MDIQNNADSKYLLEMENLWVEYHSNNDIVHAVNGIDLRIKPHETVGLVGETGAGKTTTALSIMKLLPNEDRVSFMNAQRIRFNDIDITNATQADMRAIRGAFISMIFQDPMTSLNPVMTIEQQISESILYHSNEKLSNQEISGKVDELLRKVGIQPGRKKEYPHQFSGGMKQRVVIAMALACNPKLIIADEPTTALDVTIQAQVLALVQNLKEEFGTSMLLITHDFGIVAEICDYVAVMYAGEIVEAGTVRDIFENEVHHPYTQGLMQSIPSLDEETRRLHAINGTTPDPTNLPAGCKFHPRCPYCTDQCRTEAPACYACGSKRIQCHRIAKEAGFVMQNC